jgi:hypothetical protein
MRLLRSDDGGKLSLYEFIGDDIPPYAILSHTWGSIHDEVAYKDLAVTSPVDSITDYRKKAGYNKIEFCALKAISDDLEYFWVDSCCIDKSSSAELSEAINSMFKWYQKAEKCYVYLSDVSLRDESVKFRGKMAFETAFQRSRWFTRGWTL